MNQKEMTERQMSDALKFHALCSFSKRGQTEDSWVKCIRALGIYGSWRSFERISLALELTRDGPDHQRTPEQVLKQLPTMGRGEVDRIQPVPVRKILEGCFAKNMTLADSTKNFIENNFSDY